MAIKTNIFLCMNLLCYVLTTAANTSSPGADPPLGDSGSIDVPSANPPPGGEQPATCPRDALKLGVCANLLGGLVDVVVGDPPSTPCCTLIEGLLDLEAAVCLCTAIRANVLGINVDVQHAISIVLNNCGNTIPPGYVCA